MSKIPLLNKLVVNDAVVQENIKSTSHEQNSLLNKSRAKPLSTLGRLRSSSQTRVEQDPKSFQARIAMENGVHTYPNKFFFPGSSLESIVGDIQRHIKKDDLDLEINQSLLTNRLKEIGLMHCNRLQDRIIALNNKYYNSNQELDENAIAEYSNLIDDYFKNGIQFILESQNIIFQRFTSEEINGNDLDMARAFQLNAQISKELAREFLENLNEPLTLLPKNSSIISKSVDDQEIQIGLREYFIRHFENNIRSLELASRNGLHDKEHFISFLEGIGELETKDETIMFNQLFVLTEFQEAIHGSILQDRKTENIGQEIAELDSKLTDSAISALANSIIEKVKINYEPTSTDQERARKAQRLEVNRVNTLNLREFLRKSATKELEVYKDSSENIASDPIWQILGLNGQRQSDIINQGYREINKTFVNLGRTNQEILNGKEYDPTDLYYLLNDSDSFERHYQRIVLETSLLACIDAISTFRNRKDDIGNLTELHENFETMPWLKDMYQKQFNEYLETIRKETSGLQTIQVADHMCDIAHWLNRLGGSSESGRLFTGPEFFRRYKIEDLANKMLRKMSDMTSTGQMAITLRVYANLFTYLDASDASEELTTLFLSQVKRLVKSLIQASTIKDDKGNVLYNPSINNEFAFHKYGELKKHIGSREFLTNNVDLITQFFTKSLEKEKVKKAQKGDDYSVLDAKNLFLATWLVYILAKFLPETSNDIDSMKARVTLFEKIIDKNLQGNKEIPATLYPKIRGEILGVEKDGLTPEKTGRQGIVRALCFELQEKINAHCQGKKTDLPIRYILETYKKVQDTLAANKPIRDRAENIHRTVFGSHEALFKDLSSYIPELIVTRPKTTVQFVKDIKDKKLLRVTKASLIKEISKLSQGILSQNKDSTIEILDSQKKQMQEMIKVLELIQLLGYLHNQRDNQSVTLRLNNFSKADGVESAFIDMQKLLQSKMLLRQDDNYSVSEAAFPGQLTLKNKLLNLIKNNSSNLRPALGLTHTWLNSRQINKLEAKKADQALELAA